MKKTISCKQCSFKIRAELEKNVELYKQKHTHMTGHTDFDVEEKRRLKL